MVAMTLAARDIHGARLLTKAQAAAYCGVSAATFAQVVDVRPVALAAGRTRLTRYDVHDLDAWIDRRKAGALEKATVEDILARLG